MNTYDVVLESPGQGHWTESVEAEDFFEEGGSYIFFRGSQKLFAVPSSRVISIKLTTGVKSSVEV